MADRRAQYHTNGAAAYDVYAWNQSTAPQRRPEPQHLPEERPLPQKRQRVKARTALAPFTVVGMLAVACLLVLVVFGYVQLFEATSEVSKLENQLSALQSQQTQLQSRYEARIDLDAGADRVPRPLRRRPGRDLSGGKNQRLLGDRLRDGAERFRPDRISAYRLCISWRQDAQQ